MQLHTSVHGIMRFNADTYLSLVWSLNQSVNQLYLALSVP